ncbi:SRPBCC family protein [Marinigracilibium pacificum]|uniref:Activator of Hsp90 ATPase homologue 1/2-like C-terminal domain-containing protein n=1 Tax=Marinigracilibium pacificum TaxID=2729599 RepID=A0A848ISC6_9BACT|nr:SRPBCC family protein [Marinigracilibium pacificum]NMM47353.1 hypothetical protein [Marinigracilibium pacificum]
MKTDKETTKIKVSTKINSPINIVWNVFTDANHITQWNFASEDWFCPIATNPLEVNKEFSWRMEAIDGSMGFDFNGTYQNIDVNKLIEYKIEDGRKVSISFLSDGETTEIIEVFEPESTNPLELQQQGWQAILNNLKRYAESQNNLKRQFYDIEINSNPETVYKALLNKETYGKWASVFSPGADYEGNWETGSLITFTGTDNDGKQSQMHSKVIKSIPDRLIILEHQGMSNDDSSWNGAKEIYTLIDRKGSTFLRVAMDTTPDYIEFFSKKWPKALKEIKSLSESK